MNHLFAGAVVIAMTIVGCEKSDTSTPTAATPAKPATPAMPAAPATPAAPTATIPPAPDTSAATAAANTAATQATAAANSAVSATDAEAQKLLDQTMQYIKENKLDLADTALTKLEGMKSSLSPTLQKGVTDARSMLTAAKAGGGIKIPSLGK
jgi:hypothetical protein